MIHFLRGNLAYKDEKGIVVDVGGVGYFVNVPTNSGAYLKDEGDELTIFTAMIVREDDMSLYGFTDREGLELFRMLLTVNSVGAKAALAIMSCMTVKQLKQAIALEDAASITRAQGVGKKTAQRVVLELKDKMGAVDMDVLPGSIDDSGSMPAASGERDEAISGLIALGYSKAEAAEAMRQVKETDLTSDQYLRKALSNLL